MGIDRTDPRYWRESDHYTGLTPLGVSKWLRITPLYDWPKSFNELRRIGLGAWVVDWLEFGFGSQDGELISESVILEAFLYLMYQRDVYEALAKSHGLVQVVKATVLHLQNLFKNNADEAILNVDFELVEKIMTELNGMTGDNWPDQVFAMTL